MNCREKVDTTGRRIATPVVLVRDTAVVQL